MRKLLKNPPIQKISYVSTGLSNTSIEGAGARSLVACEKAQQPAVDMVAYSRLSDGHRRLDLVTDGGIRDVRGS